MRGLSDGTLESYGKQSPTRLAGRRKRRVGWTNHRAATGTMSTKSGENVTSVTSPSEMEGGNNNKGAAGGGSPGGGGLHRTFEDTENWLDDHPDFVMEYFARKATRNMVDAWLINHAINQGAMVPGTTGGGPNGTGGGPQTPGSYPSDTASTGSNSKTSSGTNTPVRKISAQEFERSGHVFKPMVSSIDGTPTFLGPSLSSSSGTGGPVNALGDTNKTNRKSVSELKALDERELMYELVIDICNDLDVNSLCHKILQNVSLLLNADRCSLFLVRGDKDSGRLLVSTLFDVTSQSSLQDCLDKTDEIHVGWGSGIVGHVAETGDPLNIPDAYEVSGLL